MPAFPFKLACASSFFDHAYRYVNCTIFLIHAEQDYKRETCNTGHALFFPQHFSVCGADMPRLTSEDIELI